MPYKQPPIEHQFKPGHQKTGGRKKGYVSPTTELKRLLEKKISYEDPETKQQVKGKIGTVIALRAILNACQGDQNAIEDIMDRVDGKVAQKMLNEMSGTVTLMGTVEIDGKPLEIKIGD